MLRSRIATLVALLVVSLLAVAARCGHTPPALVALPPAPPGATLSYRGDVQPVLDTRCVVCHGCYDAPCQLRLSSREGLERGGSKDAVYNSSRLRPMDPTRLSMDANSVAEWRERGFSTVLEGASGSSGDALMLKMLALGRTNTFVPNARLPKSLSLDIGRELSCPTAEEFDDYAADHPLGGMPYGVAPLSDAELGTLAGWVASGGSARAPAPAIPGSARTQVERWEEFLNGGSLEERIVARYLFEHWVFAHLYFDDLPAGPFFRVVRSRTPPGQPVDVIATRRPYDDPGPDPFWYRLRPIDETIVHKTHIVYPLGEARMQRLRKLFFEPRWTATRLPGYEPEEASNPFVSFDQIPARARYQFLLDDARYFVMTFIRGPVCRGQVAVDVIEDHFFVMFLDPDVDASVTDPSFLEENKQLLSLPAARESGFSLLSLWKNHNDEQLEFRRNRGRAYDALDPQGLGPSLDFIWDGDGHNRNALLTVFRHFDNANVSLGFVGQPPETAWVISFPIFERIYYNLVVGFDVFGNVTHQAATRLYMDHLRMQAEDFFLAFLPEDLRDPIRDSWYVGATDRVAYAKINKIRSFGHGTRVPYAGTRDVREQLFDLVLARNAKVAGPPDRLNRCEAPPCRREGASKAEGRVDRALQPLTEAQGGWVALMPELSLLRVRDGAGPGRHAVYTVIHNRAHTNVAFMFDEAKRLEPEKDTLTFVPGYVGSYPNFAFDVAASEVGEFAGALAAMESSADLEAVVESYGVRRTSPSFWETFDWAHEDFRRRSPTRAGLFDLNRYGNL